MRRRYTYIQLVVLVAAALVYALVRAIPSVKETPGPVGYFYVTRVVDGDTLKLSSGEKVRLIGVDTPEVHYSNKLLKDAERSHRDIKTIQNLGKMASAFTKDLCLNKSVRIDYDVQKRDKYGRLLGYVYLEDGTFVNAKILEEGFGQVMTIPPNVKHAGHFLELEKAARAEKRGFWRDGTP